MIVTAWIIQDEPFAKTIERQIFKEQGHDNPIAFKHSIERRVPTARVEFGPVSQTGWGK